MTRAHDQVVCEDAAFEGASRVRAEVLETEDLVPFSYEQDWFAFEADGFHLVVFDFVFFYGWHKLVVARFFQPLRIIVVGRESRI